LRSNISENKYHTEFSFGQTFANNTSETEFSQEPEDLLKEGEFSFIVGKNYDKKYTPESEISDEVFSWTFNEPVNVNLSENTYPQKFSFGNQSELEKDPAAFFFNKETISDSKYALSGRENRGAKFTMFSGPLTPNIAGNSYPTAFYFGEPTTKSSESGILANNKNFHQRETRERVSNFRF